MWKHFFEEFNANNTRTFHYLYSMCKDDNTCALQQSVIITLPIFHYVIN